MLHRLRNPLLALFFAASASVAVRADGPAEKTPDPAARLFLQDHAAAQVRWIDARVDSAGAIVLSNSMAVSGFRTLDTARQKLVQMAESGGRLLVGVRDDDNGQFESGWIVIDSGVEFEDHGDHGHWSYPRAPSTWDFRLDKSQGNPAHLYVYDDNFYLANDRQDGYSRIDPAGYFHDNGRLKAAPKPAFHKGGGNHITLAVVNNQVGYGCWIDGGGPHRGKVDVTRIDRRGNDSPAYSFHLPSGAIHGAIVCENKVFFAPADGICWVEPDLALKKKADEVQVEHISLGKQNEKPRRTGAFVVHRAHVAFVTGREEGTSLILLDARPRVPTLHELPLKLKPGQKGVTPRIVKSAEGRSLAFVFHDHDKDVDAPDELTIVDLDPNRDGTFTDAQIVSVVPVGKSAVDGHFGHHDIDFDADGRWGFFTNPGDGTLSVVSLRDLSIQRAQTVGGLPTALVVRGGGAGAAD